MASPTSHWPLTSDGIRFIAPEFITRFEARHPLSRDCFPIAFGYYPKASGHRMARDNLLDNLLIYCTSGKGHLLINQTRYIVNPGDAILLPSGVNHYYYADSATPWSIYWVHFDGNQSKDFVTAIKGDQNLAPVISVGTHGRLIADFETLIEARRSGYNRRTFIHAANLLRQILSYIAAVAPNTQAKKQHNFDLDGIHALMEEKLHGQLDLNTLAAHANLSKYHFSSKYKKLTGHSPIQHFLHLKMERACYLLDISGGSIKEVSRNLGYEDSYYFSRIFKKIIGLSPKQYRNAKRG